MVYVVGALLPDGEYLILATGEWCHSQKPIKIKKHDRQKTKVGCPGPPGKRGEGPQLPVEERGEQVSQQAPHKRDRRDRRRALPGSAPLFYSALDRIQSWERPGPL